MKICESCNNVIETDTNYCPRCGGANFRSIDEQVGHVSQNQNHSQQQTTHKLTEALGIETAGGITYILPEGTSLPASINQIFSTVVDNQTEIEIHLFTGSAISNQINYEQHSFSTASS